MPTPIHAALATALPSDHAPNEIVYIPEGEHDITPFVNGSADAVHVSMPPERGDEVAAAFQRDLEARHSGNVRPWIDFEHKNGASAGNPIKFYYTSGKGLILRIDWSRAGRDAVEGKDFSYFSPSFLLGEDGVPAGLTGRGPVGGLVNEPAFRDIPRIAAADAGEPNSNETNTTMTNTIYAKLGIDPAHADAEQSALQSIEAITAERDELKKQLEVAEQNAAADRKARASQLIEAAVADGRIAPKDEETQSDFREKIEAGDAFAEKFLAKLPRQHVDLDKPIIQGGHTEPHKQPDNPYDRVEAAFAEEAGH